MGACDLGRSDSAPGHMYSDMTGRREGIVAQKERKDSEVWADNETELDLLGFEYLVDGLVVALTQSRLLPLTIGVLGDNLIHQTGGNCYEAALFPRHRTVGKCHCDETAFNFRRRDAAIN